MKIDILAIGAHPDDVELGCGGTIAKEISLGRKVGILDLTKGELGTRGTKEKRLNESKKAASILNVLFRKNLSLPDGFLENKKKFQVKIVKLIRLHKPEIILTNALVDRHPDHGKAAHLVSDSCFIAGLLKFITKHDGVRQKAWKTKNIYNYIQWKNVIPDILIDISGFLEKKKEAILAYDSQFYNPNSQEPNTPISSKNFLESIEYRAKDFGRLIGVEAAEGFSISRVPAINSLFDLK